MATMAAVSRALAFALFLLLAFRASADEAGHAWEDGVFSWKASGPLLDVGSGRDAEDPHVALKDPSIVFHEADGISLARCG